MNDKKVNVLLLCSHDPKLDPRLSWIQDYSPQDVFIHTIGLSDRPLSKPMVLHKSNGRKTIIGYKQTFHLENVDYQSLVEDIPFVATWLQTLTSLSKDSKRNVSLPKKPDITLSQKCMERFSWYLRHMLASTFNLVELGKFFTTAQVIIATDLDTLIPGIILKQHFGAQLIYDAHEFWPEATPGFSEPEMTFWAEMENALLGLVDKAFTVSPQLAQFMTQRYKTPFLTLLNCEPIVEKISATTNRPDNTGKIIFLFQGNYAPGRGLEILLENWEHTPENAILHLRGPENPGYTDKLRKIAQKSDLLKKRVFFLPPVHEKELIMYAKSASIGVIPYEPIGHNNLFCCPNKLSQFCAAGLVIFANETMFLKETIENKKLGFCFNFQNVELFIQQVNTLLENPGLRDEFAHNASHFFETDFNWQVQSTTFYQEVLHLASQQRSAPCDYDLQDITELRYKLSLRETMLAQVAKFPWLIYLLRKLKHRVSSKIC